MNILMLRGMVDERTQKVEIIEEVHDMWTLLLASMVRESEAGEVLYFGPKRYHQYTRSFYERWSASSEKVQAEHPTDMIDDRNDFVPDVIFARGGFVEYKHILKKNKDKLLVYYGAGKRYMPQEWFTEYDVILVDSMKQLDCVHKKFPFSTIRTFFKPCAERFFKPLSVEKKYDICYSASQADNPRKRVDWVYENISKTRTCLQLGLKPKQTIPEEVKWRHVSRDKMAEQICQCKIGIVPYTEGDSGPRIVPEFMACGLPMVISDRVHVWDKMYEKNPNIIIAKDEDFWHCVNKMVKAWKPEVVEQQAKYYHDNFRMELAATYLRNIFLKALDEKRSRTDRPIFR